MLRIGITGAGGFLGWHLRAYVNSLKDIHTVLAERAAFESPCALADFVRQVDVVVHLAGMNRGQEAEIERVNVALTNSLIAACDASDHQLQILFANSTHVDRDTAYGRSKRQCAEILSSWATRRGAKFGNVIMPGLFGEKGRPFYNSVVATFCFQLATGAEPRVIDDQQIEIVHAQLAAARIMELARQGEEGEFRLPGRRTTVSGLLGKLRTMAEHYENHLLPLLGDGFDLALFNTYRSYRFPKYYPVVLEQRADSRGRLFEAVKTIHGGQCFMSTTHPGVTRGNHYHSAKIERFVVIQGSALIRVRELFSGNPVEFHVTGDNPVYIDMPTFHTHNITNVGSGELLTLFWAHEIFDPANPDTFSEPV